MHSYLIIFGASEYYGLDVESGLPFFNAKDQIRNYFSNDRTKVVPNENVLDLFDSPDSAADQIKKIDEFVSSIPAESEEVRIYYIYIGHGDIDPRNNTLHLLLNSTIDGNVYGTSIQFSHFYKCFESIQSRSMIFGILDCCYAASALRGAMSPNIDEQVRDALGIGARDTERGSVILCSSGATERAYLLADDKGRFVSTKFASSLNEILINGWGSNGKERLSAHDLIDTCRLHMKRQNKQNVSTPSLFDIDQSDGRISTLPVFPVVANIPKRQTQAKVTNSDSSSSNDMLSAYMYNSLGSRLLPELLNVIRFSEIQDISYSYNGRVKDPANIVKKIERKRAEGSTSYGISDVTDVVGVRVLSLFSSNVLQIARHLIEFVGPNSKINPNPFASAKLLEVKIFSTAPGTGPTSEPTRWKAAISGFLDEQGLDEVDVEIVPRSDYSSVHLVISSPCQEGDSASVDVGCELQLRTVFEDAWAQVDHRLRYSKTRQKENRPVRNLSVTAERNLPILKRLVDAAADLAESIRSEMEHRESGNSSRIVPMDSVEQFLAFGNELAVDDDLLSLTGKSIGRKDQIDKQMELLHKGEFDKETEFALRTDYGLVAEQLNRIIQKTTFYNGENGSWSRKADKFMYFNLRLEEAYCRLQTNSDDEQSEALIIYREVRDLFPNNPVVALRYGQAAIRLGLFDEARDVLARCMEEKERKDMEPWEFTHDHRAYIHNHIHRLLGYAYWMLFRSSRLSDPDLAFSHIVEACNLGRAGLDFVEDADLRTRLKNNICYYYLDYLELQESVGGALESGRHLDDESWFERECRAFLDDVDLDIEEELRKRDTCARILSHFDEADHAIAIANFNMEACMMQDAIDRYGNEPIATIMANSWNILKKHGVLPR